VKILITGANGFVGKALSLVLEAEGHQIKQAVRRGIDLCGSVGVGELNLMTDWSAAAAGCEIVIHLAARVHVMREQSANPLSEFRKVNVDGTLSLASQAARFGVRRFVFVSTIGVNGDRTDCTPFTEADGALPHNFYALSKYEAELGLATLGQGAGMEIVIIRPPMVYGPGAKGNFATLVHWAKTGIPLPLGAVKNQRSMIALENLVNFIALCADPVASPKAANQLFLVSDGKPVSTTELLRKVALAHGRKPWLFPIRPGFLRFCAGLVGKGAAADRLLGSLVIDDSKARELLGWRPPVSMDEQLRRIARESAF